MPHPDPAGNKHVDSLMGTLRPVASTKVPDVVDVAVLREEWARLEAIPILLRNRKEAVDFSWGELDIRTIVRGEESAGRFSAHSIVLAPGAGLPAHYHDDTYAYFAVADGEVELAVGDTIESMMKYGIGFCPPLTRQRFRNVSDRPATLLIVYSPAAAECGFAAARELEQSGAEKVDYVPALERFGFHFDAAPLANDSLTNRSEPPVEFEFSEEGDLEQIRAKFYARKAIPRLVQITEAEMRDKPANVTFRREAIRGDDTAGHGMINMLGGAPGMNAPPHYQPSEDEFFFILDGALTMTCATETDILQPGAVVYCPRNCTHGFTNAQESGDVRFFTLNAPAGHERAMDVVRKLGATGGDPAEIDRLSRAGGFIFKRKLPEFPVK